MFIQHLRHQHLESPDMHAIDLSAGARPRPRRDEPLSTPPAGCLACPSPSRWRHTPLVPFAQQSHSWHESRIVASNDSNVGQNHAKQVAVLEHG